jgi:CDP-diacylglycerol--glycerol-3-phosphate 3-phosphatidyltransferase
VALNAYARAVTDRLVVPIGRGLVRVGVTPNWLTALGLALTVAGVVVLLLGHPLAGAIVMAFGAAGDAFDGTVARLRGTEGPLGAFYDSVTDRFCDAAVFGAVAWLVRDDPVMFSVTMVAMGAAFITPYIRAKAEGLGWAATVGVIERAERMILLIVAIGLGFLDVALWILAIGGLITVFQRLRAVVRQAQIA